MGNDNSDVNSVWIYGNNRIRRNKMNYNLLFFISGTLWAIELLPQLYRTYKTKSVGDIHFFFPLICFVSFLIFLTACIGIKNWVLFLSHLVPFICNVTWLVLVIIYRRKQ